MKEDKRGDQGQEGLDGGSKARNECEGAMQEKRDREVCVGEEQEEHDGGMKEKNTMKRDDRDG